MATNTISPVPGNQPLVDKSGFPTQLFIGFLTDLWSRAGGSTAPTNNQLSAAINALDETSPYSIVGNNTGITTGAIDLTAAQVNAMLPVFTALLNGPVPASGGGITKFLRADSTWSVPSVPVVFDFFQSAKVSTASSSISSASFTTASNSPAFTFIPNFTGKYKVYSSIPLSVTGTTSALSAARVFNTTGAGTLLSESQALSSGPTAVTPIESSCLAQSVYSLSSGVSYVFDIQAKVITGTSVLIDGADANFYMYAERVA